MPLYEYFCEQCDDTFELLVRKSDVPDCPECGSKKLDKLLSAPVGHVAGSSLPISGGCPPSDAPPCNPHCCRIPQ